MSWRHTLGGAEWRTSSRIPNSRTAHASWNNISQPNRPLSSTGRFLQIGRTGRFLQSEGLKSVVQLAEFQRFSTIPACSFFHGFHAWVTLPRSRCYAPLPSKEKKKKALFQNAALWAAYSYFVSLKMFKVRTMARFHEFKGKWNKFKPGKENLQREVLKTDSETEIRFDGLITLPRIVAVPNNR